MAIIPAPPDLKPTIIQMQNADQNCDESVDPKFIPPTQPQQNEQQPPKRKRRRSSSSLISQNEIEKRRREHKTAHSIIEKKRRIRMNREFEALKYLIPACRNNLTTSNNNGEGMYKLTILQSTVDYIKYLHQVINIQQNELNKNDDTIIDDDELDFAKIDVDTDAYRNLDNEYDFNKLFRSIQQSSTSSSSSTRSSSDSASTTTTTTASSKKKQKQKSDLSITKLRSHSLNDSTKFQPLPSPIITPELFPKSSSMNSSTNSTPLDNYKTINPEFQFQYQQQSSSPSASCSLQTTNKRDFQLPKPAISNSSSSSGVSVNQESKLSIINELASNFDINNDESHESSASNVLLSMKRDSSVASIRSLLN